MYDVLANRGINRVGCNSIQFYPPGRNSGGKYDMLDECE
jgi:hypothetical protein